ncbi:mucin-5AC-like isoform X2 [Candoia aspera]|uniref:mucin-5AC-like isoform X2 n=1 Tax=Candoia aspera TaxID=51853 RepID=UPI002FD7EE98
MASVTALLTKYKSGLRVKKVQEILLAVEGIDLEKFSIAQGHKDTVEFLEQQMPNLKLKYRQNRLKSIVEPESDAPIPRLESTGTADPLNTEPGLEDISTPAFTFSDPSASDSQHQSLPSPIAVVPPEVNSLFHTNRPVPSATTPNFSLFQEPHNALSVKAKSSSLSPFTVLPEQPNTCQFGAESLAEEIPSNSHLTTFQPSIALDELKQQVAHVLAMHPEGMSLFQFRAAYSATFEQHFPLGNASSAKQRLFEMPDIVYLKGHGVQVLLLPVSSDVSPVKSGQPASSKEENVAVVSSLALVKPVPPTKSAVKTLQSHSIWTPPLETPGKSGDKDCCIPKNLSPRMPLAPCQEREKARTSFTDLSDQLDLSKVQEVPVLPGHSLLKEEPPLIPQSCLKPAVPKAAMVPVPKPRHSLLQSSGSIGAPENKGNGPCTELHPQDVPFKTLQKNTWSNSKLTEIPFTLHSSVDLPTHSQGSVCDENLQPDILKSRPASLANSQISDNPVPSPSSFVTWQEPVDRSPTILYPGNSVLSVDPAPVPPVSVNLFGIHFPRSTSQSSSCAQSMLPVQTLSPILSAEQSNCNHTLADLDPFSQVQKQSRALQHSLSSVPDSSAKRHCVSSLPRNSASFFPYRSQPDHQVQQHTRARLDDLQPISVSLADKNLIKTSLDRVSSAATYVNPLETSSTRESFSTCSINEPLQSLHASSAIPNNPRTLSFISSSRTKAVSPASSPFESTTNSSDQFAYASAKITSNSNPLSSEIHAFAQQRRYARAVAAVISNRKASSSSSSSPESTTSSSHQFAYDSTRIATDSSARSPEAYGFTQQRQNTRASATASNISSPLDSTTSLSGQYAYASARTTSSSSALSSEAYVFTHQRQYNRATATAVSSRTSPRSKTPSPLKYTSFHGPPSQNNLISPLSKQGDHSASLHEKQMPYCSVPRNSRPSKSYDKCLIL